MSTTHALHQFRIATVLAAVDGTDVTDSHYAEAGDLLTDRREVSAAASAAVENATAAATVAVGDRIRSVLIRNGGSAKLSEIQRSQASRHHPHMKRVLDEPVAAGLLSYDVAKRVYRIAA